MFGRYFGKAALCCSYSCSYCLGSLSDSEVDELSVVISEHIFLLFHLFSFFQLISYLFNTFSNISDASALCWHEGCNVKGWP